jgi:thymidylate synthase
MPNKVDLQHKELIKRILDEGVLKRDRTGVGTKSIFGHQLRFLMNEGFPLLTLRRIHMKSTIHEILWFLGSYDKDKYEQFGNTNIRYLLDHGVTFWSDWPYKAYIEARKYRDLPEFTMKEFEAKIVLDDAFAKEFGSIGPGYGKQWIDYGGKVEREKLEDGTIQITHTEGINQINKIIEQLRKDPDSRRIILDAWKVDELGEMLLPPCHFQFQLYSFKMNIEDRLYSYFKWSRENDIPYGRPMDEFNFPERKLSLSLSIRSQDVYLGQPFNIAEYALLLHMIAQVVNMVPHELIINLGDAHLYLNSIDAAKKIIERSSFDLPTLHLNQNIKNIYDFRFEDIVINNYRAHSNIPVPVAV